jgi:replication factor C subunit 1
MSDDEFLNELAAIDVNEDEIDDWTDDDVLEATPPKHEAEKMSTDPPVTVAAPPPKPSPSPGKKQAMSPEAYFSGSTTSKYFSGTALATEASPSPAKRKEEGGKEGGVKKEEMEVMDVEDEDEVEEVKKATTSTAAAAAAAAPTPSPAQVKKEEGKPTRVLPSSLSGSAAASPSSSSSSSAAASTASSKKKVVKEEDEEEEDEEMKEGGKTGSRASTPKPGTSTAAASSSSSSSSSAKAVPHWQRGGGRQGALKPGSREFPQGKEGCLEGMTFVVTGVTEAFGREEVIDLIKQYGR